jgi:tetratricopeptide (TPR) repeat protein
MPSRALRLAPIVAACIGVAAAGCRRDPAVVAADHLSRGNGYAAQHKYPEARIEYLNAIKAQPGLSDAHYRLAGVDATLGKNSEALAEYSRAADLDPSNVDALLRCASLLLVAGDFRDARSLAERAITAQPKNADAHILLGDALSGLNLPGQALKKMEEAIALDPGYAPAYSALGSMQVGAGRQSEAGRSFEHAVELEPKSVPAWLALANYRWAMGDHAKTEDALKKALQLEPSNALTHRALALLYIKDGRAADAETHFRAAAAASADGVLTLSDFYVARGTPASALEVLQRVPKDSPVRRAADERIAAIDEQQGRHDEAMALANALIQQQPSDVDARVLRARLNVAANHLDPAWDDAQRAVAANPNSVTAQYTAGIVAAAKHDLSTAESAFEKALKLNERATVARMRLAEVRLALGDHTRGLADARTAAAERPDDPQSAVLLSRALRANGDLSEARQQLQQRIARLPKDSSLYAELGSLELDARNAAAARAAFAQALKLDPGNAKVREGAVAADVAAGDFTAARAKVHGWLAGPPNDDAELLAARIDLAQNDLAGAERQLLDVAQRTPSKLEAYQLLGAVYLKQGRTDAALAKYRELAAREPEGEFAPTIVGMILQSRGDRNGARAEYQAVLARHPRAPVAANNLAWMLAEDGDLDHALTYASIAVDGMSDRPEAHDTLGWVYLKKHLLGHAQTSFQRALELAPQNDTYKAHLREASAEIRANERIAKR